ncbi:hypothetical protein C3942_21850 [Solimonas fluminis]|uniref:HTH cro/C1-type domain-containing protein n=1 Tax=Solimonas fluminis TaxID=2086571 RepID=A0A2S5T9T9_9GAMM|nr:hypothetical protein [Solimonas fluminis]PPE71775.1 hypothetical protein C3942_21850 [Solimonas fluminis]
MSKVCSMLVDRIREVHGLSSDNAVSKLLGCSRQNISQWRSTPKQMDDEVATRAAELAEIDPAEILALLNAERAKSPQTRDHWNRLAILAGSAMRSEVAA